MSPMLPGGGSSLPDLDRMLAVADQRIKLQTDLVDSLRQMEDSIGVVLANFKKLVEDLTLNFTIPKLAIEFSTDAADMALATQNMLGGMQLYYLTRMKQEEYILAQLIGEKMGIEEMKKIMNSKIIRPTHPASR